MLGYDVYDSNALDDHITGHGGEDYFLGTCPDCDDDECGDCRACKERDEATAADILNDLRGDR